MLSSRSPAREATVLLRSPCLRGDGGRSRPAVDAYLGRTLHVARRSAAGGGGGGPLPDWLLGLAVEEVGRRYPIYSQTRRDQPKRGGSR